MLAERIIVSIRYCTGRENGGLNCIKVKVFHNTTLAALVSLQYDGDI